MQHGRSTAQGTSSGGLPGKTFLALQAPVIKSPPLVSSISLGMTFPVSWAPATATRWPPPTPCSGRLPAGRGRPGSPGSPRRPPSSARAASRSARPPARRTRSAPLSPTPTATPASSRRDLRGAQGRPCRHRKGGWSSLHAKTAWLGTTRATTHAKASLSIGLTGSTLWLVGHRLPHGSRADVYVDGKKVATIDTHGSTAHRHILWSKRVKKGHHVVKVVNLAT